MGALPGGEPVKLNDRRIDDAIRYEISYENVSVAVKFDSWNMQGASATGSGQANIILELYHRFASQEIRASASEIPTMSRRMLARIHIAQFS